MKFLFSSITILSTMAIFTHADRQDTAVFYQDGNTDITDHSNCIAFEKGDLTLQAIQFGVSVDCNTFDSTDCSGAPAERKPFSFDAGKDIPSNKFGSAYPHGSIQCEDYNDQ